MSKHWDSFLSYCTLLITEQKQTVKAAPNTLSQQQKQQIWGQQEKMSAHQNSTSSWGEGPSQLKGKSHHKTINPQELGHLHPGSAEMNSKAQVVIDDSFKPLQNRIWMPKKKHPKPWQIDSHELNQRHFVAPVSPVVQRSWPAESQTAAKIAAQSYLGAALHMWGCPGSQNDTASCPFHLIPPVTHQILNLKIQVLRDQKFDLLTQWASLFATAITRIGGDGKPGSHGLSHWATPLSNLFFPRNMMAPPMHGPTTGLWRKVKLMCMMVKYTADKEYSFSCII